jgi:hypothetical protein
LKSVAALQAGLEQNHSFGSKFQSQKPPWEISPTALKNKTQQETSKKLISIYVGVI